MLNDFYSFTPIIEDTHFVFESKGKEGVVYKVMRTVAKAAFIFLETYPDRTVFIEPVDMKRKRFYNAVFQRYYKEIEPIFDLFGLIGEIPEIYSPEIIYDFFELKRKKK